MGLGTELPSSGVSSISRISASCRSRNQAWITPCIPVLWLLIEWNLGVWASGNLCSRQVFDLAGTGDSDSKVCCGMLFLLCLDAVSMFYEGELCLSSTDATPFREGGRKGMCVYSARWKPWGRQACTSGGGIGNITSVTACKYYLHSSCFLFSFVVMEWCFLQLHIIFTSKSWHRSSEKWLCTFLYVLSNDLQHILWLSCGHMLKMSYLLLYCSH